MWGGGGIGSINNYTLLLLSLHLKVSHAVVWNIVGGKQLNMLYPSSLLQTSYSLSACTFAVLSGCILLKMPVIVQEVGFACPL